MQFLDTEDGMINYNRIVRVYDKTIPAGNGRHEHIRTFVEYRDANGEGQITKTGWISQAKIEGTLLPAISGYYGVTSWENDNGNIESFKSPIIGWRIQIDLDPVPVYVDGEFESDAILCPDGRLIIPNNQTFVDMDAFLNFQKLKFEQEKKEKA